MNKKYTTYITTFLIALVLGGVVYSSNIKDTDSDNSVEGQAVVVESTMEQKETEKRQQSSLADKKLPVVVKTVQAEYVADFSDDRALVGAAHNVFVGTVVKQTDVDTRNFPPRTQYEVQVVESIKGSLTGAVVVNQNAAYKDGVMYVLSDDVIIADKEKKNYLLEPGVTYLFTTRYNPERNWHNMNLYPGSYVAISTANLPSEQLKTLINTNKRVTELKAAYQDEILLNADIKNNNALNSYRSTQAKQTE